MSLLTSNFKLILLLVSLTALLMLAGQALAGEQGLVIALVFSVISQGFAYWNSDKIALAMNSAEEVSRDSAPEIYRLVENLAHRASLPMPKVYITPERSPNAFATGRDPEHSAIALTQGLLKHLDHDELACVVAHELGHIKNRDVFISTIAAVLAGTISSLAQFAFLFGDSRERHNPLALIGVIFTTVLAPILALVIQLMISRSREYEADARAVEITGNPKGLANALYTIDSVAKSTLSGHLQPAFSSLYIANPFSGINELFSTHPSIENRIRRLLPGF